MTKAHDQNALSLGIALGLVASGHDRLPNVDKMAIEFSFERAWQLWPHRAKFSGLRIGGLGTVDTIWQITHADRHKRAPYLYWSNEGGENLILPRFEESVFDVDLEGLAEYLNDQVSVDDWRSLATAFLDRLS